MSNENSGVNRSFFERSFEKFAADPHVVAELCVDSAADGMTAIGKKINDGYEHYLFTPRNTGEMQQDFVVERTTFAHNRSDLKVGFIAVASVFTSVVLLIGK